MTILVASRCRRARCLTRCCGFSTRAPWAMLLQCYLNYKTVHRRFQQWCRNEVLCSVLTDLASALRDEGAMDES